MRKNAYKLEQQFDISTGTIFNKIQVDGSLGRLYKVWCSASPPPSSVLELGMQNRQRGPSSVTGARILDFFLRSLACQLCLVRLESVPETSLVAQISAGNTS